MATSGAGSLVIGLTELANYPPATSQALYAKLTQGAWKEPVRVATTSPITNLASVLYTNFDGGTQGVTLAPNDRVLVKDGASPDGVITASHVYDGWYVVQAGADATHGKLVRDLDADADPKVSCGCVTYVCEGASAGKVPYLSTSNPITLGTTALSFGALTPGDPARPIALIDLKGAILAAGTPLVPYVAATSVGTWLDGTAPKAVVVRWPAGVTTTIWTATDLPTDLDPTYPVTVSMLVAKSGATATDVVSMTVAAYAQTVGALEDAGANLGGVSPALTTPQASLPAKTVTQLQVPIYLPPTPPARLSISFTPSGTDVTDDVSLVSAWLEYVPRNATPRVVVDLRAAILANGTPMTAWANNAGASAPGVTLDNSKAVGLRWNNQATQTAVWSYFEMPPDFDVTKPSLLRVLESKSGATVGDTMTCDIVMYAQVPGALEDAGSNLGGTTTAIAAPTATAKTVAQVTLGIPPNTLPAYPARVSFSIKPTNGVLGTDDGVNNGLFLEYQRKATSLGIVRFDTKAAELANGTPMAAFANNAGASAPGITLDNSKAVGLRWNNFATQTAVYTEGVLPLDMDVTQPSIAYVLASKSAATLADATTFDLAFYEQLPGSLEDAGPSFAGTTTALAGNAAAKTVSLLTLAIPAGTFTAAPGKLTVSIKPTNGTNATDDVVNNGFWLQYTKKS